MRTGGLGRARGTGRRQGAGGGPPAPPVSAIARGYQAARDEGTAGDLFVAPGGSNANPGTFASPKQTIMGAMAAASAGQVIRVRAGTYREIVDFTGKGGPNASTRTTVVRYGAEQVTLTAAEPLTGWTACTSGDAATVGPNWAQMFKVTIATSTIASGNPRAAFLFEAGQRLLPCMARLMNPQYPDNESATQDWLTASEVVTASGQITGIRLPALTDLYTQAQLENADVAFHSQPNLNRREKVSSFNTVTKTIVPTTTTWLYESNQYRDRFALINLLPVMKRGEWGFVEAGGNTTLFIWPNSPANVTSNIEMSARGQCVNLGGSSNCEVRGLIIERAASAGAATDGLYAINAGGVTRRSGLRIENNLIRETYRAGRDYAPINLGLIDGFVVANNTIDGAYGQFGVMAAGSQWNGSGMAVGGRVLRNVINRAENSPIRLFGQDTALVADNDIANSGVAAHANKMNAYASCHRVAFFNNRMKGASGYLTWQECSAIYIGFNDVPVSYLGTDGRAIVDQNSNTANEQSPATEQGINGDSFIFNNTVAPFRDAAANTNSITLGKSAETAVLYSGKNNILHGASTVDQTRLIANGWRNNLLTSGAALAASAGTDQTTTAAAVYEDVTLGDLRIRAASPSRSAATASIAAEIAALQALFPDYDGFGRDMNGATFSLTSPPMGCFVQPDDEAAFAAQWVERPIISGTPVQGSALTVSDGYLVARPWPSRTRQWVRSADGVTWTDIAGATGASYTVQAGDVGQYVGCRVTAGGAAAIGMAASLAVSSYPITTPVLMALAKQTSGGFTSKNIETASFTANGRPLIVVASTRNSSSADTTGTVTVGAPGRAFGTGTPLNFRARGRRTSNESQVWFIANPGTGAVTIQHQSSLTTNGVQIAVFEVEGASDVTTAATAGGTNVTSISTTVTTTGGNDGVLHIVNRFQGDLAANPITLTGVENVLSNDNTGGTGASTDLTIAIGYERAASAGAYAAAASWPTAATVGGLAIEITS